MKSIKKIMGGAMALAVAGLVAISTSACGLFGTGSSTSSDSSSTDTTVSNVNSAISTLAGGITNALYTGWTSGGSALATSVATAYIEDQESQGNISSTEADQLEAALPVATSALSSLLSSINSDLSSSTATDTASKHAKAVVAAQRKDLSLAAVQAIFEKILKNDPKGLNVSKVLKK